MLHLWPIPYMAKIVWSDERAVTFQAWKNIGTAWQIMVTSRRSLVLAFQATEDQLQREACWVHNGFGRCVYMCLWCLTISDMAFFAARSIVWWNWRLRPEQPRKSWKLRLVRGWGWIFWEMFSVFFSRCFLTFPQFLFFFKSLLSFFPTKLVSDGDEKILGVSDSRMPM